MSLVQETSKVSRRGEQMTEEGPTGPSPLSIADLLADQSVLEAKEQEDGRLFAAIGTLTIKPSLLQWARQGFPNAFCVHEIPVQIPSICSDGVTRSLADYIVFCSGKTIHEHVALLQSTLLDIVVQFSYTGSTIQIVVFKA